MSTVIAAAVERIRAHLKQHSASVRPVPLAKQLGLQDIRVVRSALRQMSDQGELVSCTVYVEGMQDYEYRLSTAPNMATNQPIKPRDTHVAPRRPDASSAPSRLRLDDQQSRQVSVVQATITPYAGRPAATKPAIAVRVNVAAHGARKKAILAFIEAAGRNVTANELLGELQSTEPALTSNAITSALWALAKSGALVCCGHAHPPGGGRLALSYATPAIAERLKSNTQGSGGESTPAAQPVLAEAAVVAAAAPLVAIAPEPKTAQRKRSAPLEPKTAESEGLRDQLRAAETMVINLDEQLQRALAFNAQVDPGFNMEVRARLEAFFQSCNGDWYGLPSLVRICGGSVPDTLESLAALQRAKKLSYSEADRSPIWHPVEGCW